MKITKQRLKEIFREELNEIMPEPDLAPDPELRREIRDSKRALAAAMKRFVTLQNFQPGTRPEWGPRQLRKFVDNWLREWE